MIGVIVPPLRKIVMTTIFFYSVSRYVSSISLPIFSPIFRFGDEIHKQ